MAHHIYDRKGNKVGEILDQKEQDKKYARKGCLIVLAIIAFIIIGILTGYQ